MKDSKLTGDTSELLFQLRSRRKGFIVSKPCSEGFKYDRIVDYKGKLNRIQIKAATISIGKDRKHGRYKINTVSSKQKQYTKKDIDFFACHCVEDDIWFIIPVNNINCNQISINLISDKPSKFDKYKENWKLLKRRKK